MKSPRARACMARVLAAALIAQSSPAAAGTVFRSGSARPSASVAPVPAIAPSDASLSLPISAPDGLLAVAPLAVPGAAPPAAEAGLPSGFVGAEPFAAALGAETARAAMAEAPTGPSGLTSGLAPTAAIPAAGEFGLGIRSAASEGVAAGGESGARGSANRLEGSLWDHARQRGFAAPGSAGEEAIALAASDSTPGLEPSGAADARAPAAEAPAAPALPFIRTVGGFFSTFILVQVTVEALGLVVPQMTDPLTQGFLVLAALSSISYLAYSLGSFVGGRLVTSLGIRNVYRTVLSLRALIWTAFALLFDPASEGVAIAPMIALFSLDYFVHSIGRVAEHTLQVAWFKDQPVASNRFGTFRDFVEYGTVFTTLLVGLAVATWGFGVVVYAAPVMFGLAALGALLVRNLPRSGEAKKFSFAAGFKALFADRGLLKLFAASTLISSFFYTLYYIHATAFGVFSAQGDARQSTIIAAALTGVYGIGALLGTLVTGWITNRVESRTAGLEGAAQAEAQTALFREATARALRWAAVALLGTWLFMFLTPLATLVWPIFAATPALLVIGITSQIALTLLDTAMKARMPKELAGSIVGASRTLTYFSYAVSFVVWGALFQLLATQGFLALAAYATASAAAYLLLSRSLGKPAPR